MSGKDYALVAGTGCATGFLWSTLTGDLDLSSSQGWLQASLSCAGSSISSSGVFFAADRLSQDKNVAYQATGTFWALQGGASTANWLGRVNHWQEEPAFNALAFPLNFAATPLTSTFSLLTNVLGYTILDAPHKSVQLYGGRLVFVHGTTLYQALGFKPASRTIGAVGTDMHGRRGINPGVPEHETGHTVQFSVMGDLGFSTLYGLGALTDKNPLETWADDYGLKLTPPFSQTMPPLSDEAFRRVYRQDPFFKDFMISETAGEIPGKEPKNSPMVDPKQWLQDLTSGEPQRLRNALETFRDQGSGKLLLVEFINEISAKDLHQEKSALEFLRLYTQLLRFRGNHTDDDMLYLEEKLFMRLPLKNRRVVKQAVLSGVLTSYLNRWIELMQQDQGKSVSLTGLRDGIVELAARSPFFCYRLVAGMIYRPDEVYDYDAPMVREVFLGIYRRGLVKSPLFNETEVAQFEDLVQRYRHRGWNLGAAGSLYLGGESGGMEPGAGLWLGYRNVHRLGLRLNLNAAWASGEGSHYEARPAWIGASLEPILYFIKAPKIFDAYLTFELGGKHLIKQAHAGVSAAMGLGVQAHVDASTISAGVKNREDWFPKEQTAFRNSAEFFLGISTSF